LFIDEIFIKVVSINEWFIDELFIIEVLTNDLFIDKLSFGVFVMDGLESPEPVDAEEPINFRPARLTSEPVGDQVA